MFIQFGFSRESYLFQTSFVSFTIYYLPVKSLFPHLQNNIDRSACKLLPSFIPDNDNGQAELSSSIESCWLNFPPLHVEQSRHILCIMSSRRQKEGNIHKYKFISDKMYNMKKSNSFLVSRKGILISQRVASTRVKCMKISVCTLFDRNNF